jgi:hypothetical protein
MLAEDEGERFPRAAEVVIMCSTYVGTNGTSHSEGAENKFLKNHVMDRFNCSFNVVTI